MFFFFLLILLKCTRYLHLTNRAQSADNPNARLIVNSSFFKIEKKNTFKIVHDLQKMSLTTLSYKKMSELLLFKMNKIKKF